MVFTVRDLPAPMSSVWLGNIEEQQGKVIGVSAAATLAVAANAAKVTSNSGCRYSPFKRPPPAWDYIFLSGTTVSYG